MEYYGQCFCGTVVNSDSVSEDNCNDACTGNHDQMCGGTDYLSIYEDPDFSDASDVSIADYEPQGCYLEGVGGRALVYRQDQVPTANLTIEACLAACQSQNYPYAGVEYGEECYCGVQLTYGAAETDDSVCNKPCNGDADDTCGGPGALNVYLASSLLYPVPCQPATSTTSSTVAPTTSSVPDTTTTTSTGSTTAPSTTLTTSTPGSTTSTGTTPTSTTISTSTTPSTSAVPSTITKTSTSSTSTTCATSTTSKTSTTLKTTTTTTAKTSATPTPTPTPCGLGAPCKGSCCSACTNASSFFCPKAQNPFLLSCQSGRCVLPPPCAQRVCVSTQFNDNTVAAGATLWLSAAFTPRFALGGGPAGVSVTNAQVTIGAVTKLAPDAYVELIAGAPAAGAVSYVNNQWQATVPLGQQTSFLSAVGVTVPAGLNCRNARVTWCGDITAPGQIDASVAAAVYSSCPYASAQPQAVDAGKYKAGAPVGCATSLKPGGTGRGNGDFCGVPSWPVPVCRGGGCSKPRDNSGASGYGGNGKINY